VVVYSRLYHGSNNYPVTDFIRTASSVALFIYTPLTEAVYTYLNCIDVAGERIVAKEPAIRCNDPTYFLYLPVVIGGLAVVIASPVVLVLFLWRNARPTSNSGSNTRRIETIFFMSRWGIFYERYKSKSYWWTGWTLGRRTLLVALATFVQDRGQKFAWISLIQLLALGMQIAYVPYLAPSENFMELVSLVALLILTIILGSYNLPYPLVVSVILTLMVFIPAIIFIGILGGNMYLELQRVAATT